MTRQIGVAVLIVVFGACGGKKGTTTPEPDDGLGGDRTPAVDNTGTMVTPETMDEIQRLFQRKGNAVSRCLSIAVDNKELPKNSRGKVTLDVTISAGGSVGEVKVLKASLESKSLNDCIIAKVKEIQFPTLPKEYPTTYTYAFEAM